jgi:hypothetical protein
MHKLDLNALLEKYKDEPDWDFQKVMLLLSFVLRSVIHLRVARVKYGIQRFHYALMSICQVIRNLALFDTIIYY